MSDARFQDGLPAADYHKHHALGSSGVSALLDCPATFDYLRRHPEDDPETAATELGTAIHTFVLEPGSFAPRYFITPPGFTRARKDDKAVATAEEAKGLTQITSVDYEKLKVIREAVMACEDARLLIENAEAVERTAFWMRGDVECKARFDIDAVTATGLVADLKSAADPNPASFARGDDAVRRAVQALWYSDGYLRVTEDAMPRFCWIVVPTTPPYHGRVWVGEPDESFLRIAQARTERAVGIYRKCRETNVWPGYAANGIVSLAPTGWMVQQEEAVV